MFKHVALVLAVAATLPSPCGAGEWKPLFNGKDLSGWSVQCRRQDRAKAFWRVDAGTILVDSLGLPDHDYVWLATTGEYSDFDLKLKFQVYEGIKGNGGVQIRSRYDVDDGGGWMNGPQLDIDPPDARRAGMLYDETHDDRGWRCPAAKKGSKAPPVEHANPKVKLVYGEGAWNEMEIVAKGTHVVCVVNGETACDYDGSGVLDNAIHRRHKVGMDGHIALQLHNKSELKLRFKDIEIQEL